MVEELSKADVYSRGAPKIKQPLDLGPAEKPVVVDCGNKLLIARLQDECSRLCCALKLALAPFAATRMTGLLRRLSC